MVIQKRYCHTVIKKRYLAVPFPDDGLNSNRLSFYTEFIDGTRLIFKRG